MTAWYNENDPFAAQWLRNLIAEGLIAPGVVDDRDIRDVRPQDLAGFDQHHFFAGIGGWSYALRLSGWPDDRPVWTGSCPCQPFSAAGQGLGADDDRHLWPAWFRLIAEFSPAVVLGEQVEAAIGWGWLDLVFDDLGMAGYACAAAVLPACSVGAPHLRNRLWFVADAGHHERPARPARGERQPQPSIGQGTGGDCSISILADAEGAEQQGRTQPGNGAGVVGEARICDEPLGRLRGSNRPLDHAARQQVGRAGQPRQDGARQLGDAGSSRLPARQRPQLPGAQRIRQGRAAEQPSGSPWADIEWLPCSDGKQRPVEPGTFPLVDRSAFRMGSGVPLQGKSRVGMLRGYGNAIVPQVAALFIGSYMEASSELAEISSQRSRNDPSQREDH